MARKYRRLALLACVMAALAIAIGLGFRQPQQTTPPVPQDVAAGPAHDGAGPLDWPHVRGPQLDGISRDTGLADAWPAAGPPILWTRDLGQGYSSFIAVGRWVYTQYQVLAGQYLVCLSADTGAEKWRLRYDAAWQRSGAYPGPYASPTWCEGRVYFASPSGLVGTADAETGALLWSRNLLREFRGRGAGFGFACSPLVEAGLVIFPVGGPGASMVAMKAEDGTVAWQAGDDPASYCPAFPITWQGQRLVVGYLRNALVLHDLRTGRVVGRMPLSSDYDEHSAWPIYREPDLFLAAPFRLGAQLLRLEPKDDGVSPRPIWSNPSLANDVVSSVLHEDCVYGFDLKDLQARVHRSSRGMLRCLDFATGKVLWSTEETGHASLVVADGKLILFNDTGTLLLARASPTGYEELARHTILQDDEMCWTPPVLARGRLLLRNHHRAVCVYLGQPEALAPQLRAQDTTADAVPVARSWDWNRLIGCEPEFPNDAPSWSELALWFVASIGVFVLAGAFAATTSLVLHLLGSRQVAIGATVAFWWWAFALAVVAAPVLGDGWQQFVWTWPVALYVAFQVTIQTIVWVEGQAAPRRARWLSRGVVLTFLSLCWLYYTACQQLGLATIWAFLIGFLPAWPFAVAAARRQERADFWQQALLVALAFSVYYWSGGAFIAWKTSIAEVWEHL